jgi:glyoxylase-like metal-dependent hydrolase (beta-lactamase superfamily II)
MTEAGCAVHRLISAKITSFFLLVNDGELTLIDTGNKDKIENIRSQFGRTGHSLDQLKRIIVTHCHPDHIGSLARLKQATGAEVLAHEDDAPVITHASRLPRPRRMGVGWVLHAVTSPLAQPERCQVDRTLKDGESIEGTGLTVIHVPGHSPGSICLYDPATRVLFSGDALVNWLGRMRGPIPAFSWDIQRAHRSLAKLLALDVQTIYFAHGEPIVGGGKEKIRSLVDRLNVV